MNTRPDTPSTIWLIEAYSDLRDHYASFARYHERWGRFWRRLRCPRWAEASEGKARMYARAEKDVQETIEELSKNG